MTYKILCKCGSEFYLSTAEETCEWRNMAIKEADKWRADHKACCDTIEIQEKLPEDWKL